MHKNRNLVHFHPLIHMLFYLTLDLLDHPVVMLTVLLLVALAEVALTKRMPPGERCRCYERSLGSFGACTAGVALLQLESSVGVLRGQTLKEVLELLVLAGPPLVALAQAANRTAASRGRGGGPVRLRRRSSDETVELATQACVDDPEEATSTAMASKAGCGSGGTPLMGALHTVRRLRLWLTAALCYYLGVVFELRLWSTPAAIAARHLNLLRSADGRPMVTLSGVSNGADFAVQCHVAMAGTVRGVCGFAAQPWRCAATRFGGEPLVRRNATCRFCTRPFVAGIAAPLCAPGCAPDLTLRYDHCKHDPAAVDVRALAAAVHSTPTCTTTAPPSASTAAATTAAADDAACVDDPALLASSRVYLFRGMLDATYARGAVANTAALYARLGLAAGGLALVDDVAIGHTLPRLFMCSPRKWALTRWLEETFDGPGRNCTAPPLDGAAECFAHLLAPARLVPPRWWGAFWHARLPLDFLSQYHLTLRASTPGLLLAAPRACRAGARCRLHIHLGGCRGSACHPAPWAPRGARLLTDSFHVWASTNRVVVAYLQPHNPLGGTATAGLGEVGHQGCWDVYGQTGGGYATQGAVHVRQVRQAVAVLFGEAGWPELLDVGVADATDACAADAGG